MNMSNFTGDSDTDMRVGFNVGVGMEYQFTDMWSIQPSLMFTQNISCKLEYFLCQFISLYGSVIYIF